MCGRFALTVDYADLQARFAFDQSVVWKPKYNIAPGQYVAALKTWGKLDFLSWGLLPAWLQAKNGTGIINARIETLAEKPAFRNSINHRRCLILANGYYEWKQQDRIKQPYYVAAKDGKTFCFAGLWDGETCAIITAAAGADTAWLHERRPIIVPEHGYQQWLDSKKKFVDVVPALIVDNDPELTIHPVTPQVNRPAFDTQICTQPIAAL